MWTVLIISSTILKKITYFKDKTSKWKNKHENYKTLNTWLNAIVIIGITPTSIALSITGIGFVSLPISDWIACALSLVKKVLHKMIINIYKKTKNCKKNINNQLNLSIKFTAKVYKILRLIRMKMILYVIFSLNIWMNQKTNFFYKYEHKNNIDNF